MPEVIHGVQIYDSMKLISAPLFGRYFNHLHPVHKLCPTKINPFFIPVYLARDVSRGNSIRIVLF